MVTLLEILDMRFATSKSKKRKRYCKCICDCGKEFETTYDNVKAGIVNSCGCKKSIGRPITHNLTKHPHYKRWVSMNLRCNNPKDQGYHNYGARGITVCPEWQDVPNKYVEYVSKLPNAGKPGYSIDRIDNNGNYEPGNIKWSTTHEQNSNMRRNTIKQSGEEHITWYTKTEKWRVRLNGKQIGSFVELSDAIKARDSYMIG